MMFVSGVMIARHLSTAPLRSLRSKSPLILFDATQARPHVIPDPTVLKIARIISGCCKDSGRGF
ncbi:MAG: hypothetical protein INF75_02695 [Roseomonas sp.]|nr:hypothetical protein [Roseomonas sp.]MCA3327827.1 hypothetical protein [Roseomonas sp.]MCA3329625.1 hypothetical protein [Roseomonas sp.]MCA3334518.1 hypothetical protein [Roseomonas sp.]MCA3348184.1 hypothetical protein [Roseomonas sp.]